MKNETLETVRENFSHHARGQIYLNHASIGPMPAPAVSAVKKYLDARHHGPVENFEPAIQMLEETRGLLAEYIGAAFPSQIAFMGNTSEGISAVANGFRWNAGDQVILNTLEFPANVQPFRALKSRGVELVFAEPEDGRITPELLEKAITPNTKMLSVSAVQFLNGYRADLNAIGDLCHSHGIYFVVDGIQALGGFRIDVRESRIDALASGGHKWLLSPMGTGFLYLSERMQSRLNPVKTGWFSVENPFDMLNYEQRWLDMPQHLETGTPNILGTAGLGASLNFFLETGTEQIEKQILSLTGGLIKKLSGMNSVQLLTPEEEENRSGIVSFSLSKSPPPEDVVEDLKKKQITISSRNGYFRISPHFYNTADEIDTALEAIFKS